MEDAGLKKKHNDELDSWYGLVFNGITSKQ